MGDSLENTDPVVPLPSSPPQTSPSTLSVEIDRVYSSIVTRVENNPLDMDPTLFVLMLSEQRRVYSDERLHILVS